MTLGTYKLLKFGLAWTNTFQPELYLDEGNSFGTMICFILKITFNMFDTYIPNKRIQNWESV